MLVKSMGHVRIKSPRAATALSAETSNRASRALTKREPSSFFKVIRMSIKRLYLVMLLLVIGYQQVCVGADRPTPPANDAKAPAKAELSKQLKIYKTTLLEGKNEQIRIDVAVEMLISEDPLAREILLAVLKQSENIAARQSVCKALSRTRVSQKPIENKEDFIQPLLDILTTDDANMAKLAAEATLIFEYEQISKQLEELITNQSLPVQTRLNATYVLKLHPDMRAAIKLIQLVDDPESQVAVAAEMTLRSLGIQVGEDAEARKQIIEELKREGQEAFLQKRLIHQEEQIREMRIELTSWQGKYLSALDTMYNGISDDAAKGKFLDKYLRHTEAVVRLWALEKVRQWRRAPGTPELPSELEPILINLISDQDRIVRLRTANLLSLITEFNSAQRLLAQLEIEQDDEVKMELFVALGYAFSPGSPIKIPNETRQQALKWARKYLSEQEPKKAQTGADVMKKLLGQDGLKPEEVDHSLGLLTERYNREKKNPNGALRGELLSAMAGLCAQGSACKAKADELFKNLFEEALRDETDSVREAAVDGLIYINKTAALKRLRKDFVNDRSSKIRERLINVAGEVGGKDDLTWLAEKIGSNSESKLSWQAMLKIFTNSDAGVLNEWIDKLIPQGGKSKLSDEQKIAFLEMAEGKAVGAMNPQMLKNIRKKLAELYYKTGQFERAADCLDKLHKAAETTEEKEAILPDLLNAYLRCPKVEPAATLVQNRLLKKDLDPNDIIVSSIENYLSKPPVGADPNVVLKALTEIQPSENRPKWREWLKQWTYRLGKAKGPDKAKKDSDEP